MKSRRIFLTFTLTILFCLPVYLISYEDGPPARRTGGPFPGEQTCNIAECHVGTEVNGGGGKVTMTIKGVAPQEYAYTPGETVPVVVHVEDPAQQRWGFEMTARTEDGCGQAGTFQSTEQGVQIYNSGPMDDIAECPAETLQLPMHLQPKIGAGGADFSFNWTAPATAIGPIWFAAAGNAANGNREPTGDHIYTTSAVVQAAPTEPAPKPSVAAGGIVTATGTPVVTSISPNSIITIFGEEFAAAGTQVLNPAVDIEGRVATQLAGVCVEVNGIRSPIFAVFPTQINLQAPTTDAQGPVSVVAVRACGTPSENRSDAQTVNVASVAPAFFNFLNNQDGVNPIATLHGGGPALVGPPGLFGSAVETTPAAPGEFVSLFATGLGLTNTTPPLQAGEIPANTNNSQATVAGASVTIGGVPILGDDLFYVGVAPCCAGLYQIVAKVPDAAQEGLLPVVVTINGVSSPEGPYIAVQRP